MNSNRYLVLFVLLILCVPMMVSAFGKKENVIKVTGVVRLVGTGLFPELVITGSENEWYIDKEEMDKLHNYQHRTVTVEGVETLNELIFVNGQSAWVRRELKKIKIISIN